MESFVYEYPTKVYFGKGAAKQHLAVILSAYGPNVLLAYGGGSIKRNGIYDEITGILKEAGKTVTEFTGIMSNPIWEKVKEGAKLARDNKIDLVLAVGGGSVIDCCKIVCAQAVTDEDLWKVEMVCHGAPAGKPIPLGAVVTACFSLASFWIYSSSTPRSIISWYSWFSTVCSSICCCTCWISRFFSR